MLDYAYSKTLAAAFVCLHFSFHMPSFFSLRYAALTLSTYDAFMATTDTMLVFEALPICRHAFFRYASAALLREAHVCAALIRWS